MTKDEKTIERLERNIERIFQILDEMPDKISERFVNRGDDRWATKEIVIKDYATKSELNRHSRLMDAKIGTARTNLMWFFGAIFVLGKTVWELAKDVLNFK